MDRPTLEEIIQEEDPVVQRQLRNKRERIIDDLFHPIYSESKVEYEWLVENFLPKGYLAILAGQPKSGKTCLATALALAIATGTPFAEMPTEQTGVLWLSLEEGQVERRQILDLSPLSDPTTPLYTCYQPLAIDNEDDLCVLFTCARRNSADFIVIDPLHAATSGRSLADGWAARKSLQPLKQMCNATGVTALILHHSKEPSRTNRRPRVAESDQLAATASMHMVLTTRSANPLERGLQSASGPRTSVRNASTNDETNSRSEEEAPSERQLQSASGPRTSVRNASTNDETDGRSEDGAPSERGLQSASGPRTSVRNASTKNENDHRSEEEAPSERGLQSASGPRTSVRKASTKDKTNERSEEEAPTERGLQSASGPRTSVRKASTNDETNSRLLTLQMQGRGAFANRVLHLHSSDPVTYVPIDEPETPKRMPTFGPTERTLIEVLKSGPKTCDEIAEVLKTSRGTLYNALLRLRSKGVVWRKRAPGRNHLYTLLKTPVLKNDA